MTYARAPWLLVFCALLCMSAAAQDLHRHAQPQLIDGSKTPDKIPDAVARRLFFYNITVPQQATEIELLRQAAKLRAIGLNNQQIAELKQEVEAFRRDFDAVTAEYNLSVNRGAIPRYSIDSRLDRVVEALRSRLAAASLLDKVDQRIQSEKVRMKAGLGQSMTMSRIASVLRATPDSTEPAVTMEPKYSSYATVENYESDFGSFGFGMDETVEGYSECLDSDGNPTTCPDCTHQPIDSTTFDGGDIWTGDGGYPNPGDGASMVSSGQDGTLLALSGSVPYVFGGNGSQWTALTPPAGDTVVNITAVTATTAYAVLKSSSAQQSYLYNPTTNSYTLLSPPNGGAAILKVQWGGAMFTLDTKGEVWVSNGTSGSAWQQVPGTFTDIGGSSALGAATGSGNVYQMQPTTQGGWAAYAYLNEKTFVSLGDGGGYGIDSSANLWEYDSTTKKWVEVSVPAAGIKQVSAGANNIVNTWALDKNGDVVRYLPTIAVTADGGRVSPSVAITYTGGGAEVFNLNAGDSFEFEGTSDVDCSCVGTLFSSILQNYIGHVQTLVSYTGTQSNCETNNGVTMCDFSVVPNCTTTPTWAPSIVSDSPPPLAGWWCNGICVRVTTSAPWECEPVPAMAFKTTQTTPGNCTVLSQ